MSEIGHDEENPVISKVNELDTSSAVAVAGHPLHAMSVHFPITLVFATLGADVFYWYSADPFWLRVGVWTAGAAFFSGLAAGAVGTIELLAVPGIRSRVASWAHAIAAIVLVAIAGLNWGLRLSGTIDLLPHGLFISVVACIMTGMAGWHGGKLIFDHGIGLMVSSKD
ncbi:DUF2231 domain-containing protein [Limoniibacter endophyticus]|uniref:DUF2231 domain-containing protein n=1 Tax=Limoniibacter endophyticus TaxID=1565040 RepID=A0A8J3DJ49_9HYPH|nr:DUF2231 domain-containing protein [Limoniibacter endophyticus]GHC72442.1 hypothetical protein GCM10010136_20150 [Limoniibacter endophyticus]